MKTLTMEKSKSETYSIMIGTKKELKSYDGSLNISTVKDIIDWNYLRPNGLTDVVTDVELIIKEDPNDYLEGLSYALRFAGENAAKLFEWMIANLYEIMDVDKDIVSEFVVKLWEVKINIYEKKTKKEREMVPVSRIAEAILSDAGDFPYRDVVSMSMVFQSYLSWKCDLLSMEEYYEIRDMFVPFGLGISQSKCKPEEVLQPFLTKLSASGEYTLLKKLGKSVPFNELSPELCLSAWEELYFDETAND